MTKVEPPSVLTFRLPTGDLQTRIRDVAAADEQIFFGTDLRSRLFEIGLSRLDIVRFLQACELVPTSVECEIAGQWRCRVWGRVLGVRDNVSAAILFDGSRIFVSSL